MASIVIGSGARTSGALLPVRLDYVTEPSRCVWAVDGVTVAEGLAVDLDLSAHAGRTVQIGARAKWGAWYDHWLTYSAPPTDRLSWAPPELEDPTEVVITHANRKARLDLGRDYIVRLPGSVGHPQRAPLSLEGGFALGGGRNVHIIGGAIRHDVDYLTGTTGSRGTANRAMWLGDWTGDLFVEGVEIAGDCLYEGINVRSPHPAARLFLQNISLPDPILALVGGGHEGGDALQNWDGPNGGLFIDGLSAHATSYQGLFMQPAMLRGIAGAPARTVLRRVSISHGNLAGRPLPDAPYDPPRSWGNGAQQLVFSGNPDRSGPIELDDVWVNPAPKFTRVRDAVAPVSVVADDGLTLSWPARPDVTGVVNIGLPPDGHFVTGAGLDYVSPGYR